MPTQPIEVFISYRWTEPSILIVDEIQKCLSADGSGIRILRDNTEVGYKGDLEAYMKRLGAGHFVILVLSDGYFKSRHCMNELVMLRKHEDFADRIFPIVLDDAKIRNIEGQLDYRIFWQEKKDALNEKLRLIRDAVQIQDAIFELNLYDDIMASILGITAFLNKMNSLSVAEHQKDGYAILRKSILGEVQ